MIDDFEETIVMESSPGYEETFNSSSENESSCDRGNSSETAQMGSGHQNPSAIKADYEIAGIVGEITELLEEGKHCANHLKVKVTVKKYLCRQSKISPQNQLPKPFKLNIV